MESFLFFVVHSLLVVCFEQHSNFLYLSPHLVKRDYSETAREYFMFTRIQWLISFLCFSEEGMDLLRVRLNLEEPTSIEVHLGSIIIKVNLPYFAASVSP